jgi:ABC-type glycerol-3-phosphate transport system substrate-binding protein
MKLLAALPLAALLALSACGGTTKPAPAPAPVAAPESQPATHTMDACQAAGGTCVPMTATVACASQPAGLCGADQICCVAK